MTDDFVVSCVADAVEVVDEVHPLVQYNREKKATRIYLIMLEACDGIEADVPRLIDDMTKDDLWCFVETMSEETETVLRAIANSRAEDRDNAKE